MAYVAVTGGVQAIEASIELLHYYRSGGERDLDLEAVRHSLGLLVDRIMGEAGLYAPELAALALKQCEGSPEEAVFLLRAYRSTLARNHTANPLRTDDMRLVRRISAAFKDIPGGQMLGPTYDYTHRLLDFSLREELPWDRLEWRENFLSKGEAAPVIGSQRVTDLLRAEGLLAATAAPEEQPFDVTARPITFPAPRSARLQTLARADTGYITGLAYSSLRGYGAVHPTVGELRCGHVPVTVAHPLVPDEELWLGEVLLTEVESFVPHHAGAGGSGNDSLGIAVGYGVAMGRNENKAIAMSILDRALDTPGPSPAQDEEFVLTHGDNLESNGFISHLKLPHYVTFQSKLESVRRTREGNADE